MTTTKTITVQEELDNANPNTLADALKKAGVSRQLGIIKAVVTALTATATPDITTAAVLAAAVVTGAVLETGELLPPIGDLVALRVTASGTAASLGTYILTDTGGTALLPPGGASAAVGIAKISDDGKTLTFPNTVTAFTLIYRPRSVVDISTTVYAPSV